ncbi:uncharacterized fcp1 homology domain-containing protein c1271.03c [Phtheirospermum japonicum]|uniref:Mitochondrial import inner membrane translocase subunit TIM50 n=1 Tax=Phtheirospermum japonicum TaxID=374723 RepID=A0A830B5A2_9LAMI|nr:uncharacterized fcp1 homology domain-containing protein c1271.03c [Phtheirospermum japonicum]
MDIEVPQNPAVGSSKRSLKRKRKQLAKKEAMAKNGPQIKDNTDGNLEVSNDTRDCIIVNNDLEKNIFNIDLAGQTLAECPKIAAELTIALPEVNGVGEVKIRQKKTKKKAKKKVKVQSNDQMKMDTESTKILAEVNVNVKRKRNKKNKKKTKNKDAIRRMEQTDQMLNLHLSDGDHGRGINGRITENELTTQESEVSLEIESSLSVLVKGNGNSSDLCAKEEAVLLPDVAEVSCSSDLVEERPGDFLRPMEVEEKLVSFEYLRSSDPDQMDVKSPKFENGLNEVNSEIVVDEGTSVLSTCDVELTTHVSCPDVKEAECLFKHCPQIAPISSSKRKLIVLDVNGLLANIFFPAPKDYRGDAHILGRAVFKRPFCDDFLKFCFQNFDVGIWSSRSKKLIDRVVEYLLGDLQDKLLFCWDMDHSTQTGYKTLENYHKPLVCKELRKIWESDDPNLPWEKGYYNESNTLLLDDSPYKALLNPLHTAIFPNSYHHEDKSDNSLGPGGDLRVYLEGLLTSENVQKYVEQHPFGQSAINETSLSWEFYSGACTSDRDEGAVKCTDSCGPL